MKAVVASIVLIGMWFDQKLFLVMLKVFNEPSTSELTITSAIKVCSSAGFDGICLI